MLKNWLKTTIRNFRNNKIYSAVNILGLAIGMSVALLIGLWIRDETTFNHYFKNHERLGEIVSIETFNGVTTTEEFSSVPIAAALRMNYSAECKNVASIREVSAALSAGNIKINASGYWAEPAFPSMLPFEMVKGSINTFNDPSSILISENLAATLFNNEDPVNRTISLNNEFEMKVAGVYKNPPDNTKFRNVSFYLAWNNKNNSGNKQIDDWIDHHFQVYVQLNDQASFAGLSAKIRDMTKAHIPGAWEELLVHPMDRWHLHTDFIKEGKIPAGCMQFVWLFGIIGSFVLLLACINFMNLSTARSVKRAKEVGIRKTMGSSRGSLVAQFIGESILMSFVSLSIALLSAQLFLPSFNLLAGKELVIPYGHFTFWLCVLGFTLFTGLLAGSYPAFFLSGFNPVRVLKGNFKTGRLAAMPRKVMVVVQFTVCIALIIGTIIIYQQIRFAKNRPMGYSAPGLITVEMKSENITNHWVAFRNDLLQTGAIENMAASSSPSTEVKNSMINYNWEGKDPNTMAIIGTLFVTPDFGNTIKWKLTEGRDFSSQYPGDSTAFILNEAAVNYARLKNPVGKIIRWRDHDHPIIGVVKNMVMESPYSPVQPVFFTMYNWKIHFVTIRIKPDVPVSQALAAIESVFKKYYPETLFEYAFTTDMYDWKFTDEEHIGHISTVFCVLAIFISCLGLFGLSSFIAEQRTKEIAVRKVLGASVINLWTLMSAEFISLVLLSCFIAVPIAWYILYRWLLGYDFRTPISGWIFFLVGAGTIIIALLTISIQIIKAAFLNPIRQLRSE